MREDFPKACEIPGIYRLGDLSLDPGTQRVFRGDAEINLPKLSFDLLMALARAAPNTVSHEQILEQVWPGLVVSPETVTQRVKLLRDALGDDSRAPRYIGLVRGRGYRLLAPVETATATTDSAIAGGRSWSVPLVLAALLLVAVAWFFIQREETAPGPPAATDLEPSIAVLPLVSVSAATGEGDPLAAGIHDELLTRLAQVPGLRVISRGSVLQYADSRKSMREIGRELGVSTLLEGSVQRAGDRVRINVQLIEAATDTHLWAQAYDRELSVANLLDIRSDIATTIADSLRVELLPASDVGGAAPAATESIDAYLAYLKAREYRNKALFLVHDPDLLLTAEDHLRMALALDPSFALAEAELGRLLAEIYWQEARPRTAVLLEQSREATERALELRPGLPEAHLARAAYLYYGHRRYEEALAKLALAESAMPGSADVYQMKGWLLRRLGRLDESVATAELLVRLEPRGAGEALQLARLQMLQGRSDEARESTLRALALGADALDVDLTLAKIEYNQSGDPQALLQLARDNVLADAFLAWEVGWATGDLPLTHAALDAMERDDTLGGDRHPFALFKGLTDLRSGHVETGRAEFLRLRRGLERELAQPQPANPHNSWMTLALTLAALEEMDAAVAAGRRAVDELPLERDRFQGARLLVELAFVCAQAGDFECALLNLERGLAEPFAPLPLFWQPDPRLDPLRDQDAFQKLVAEHGTGSERWARRGAPPPSAFSR